MVSAGKFVYIQFWQQEVVMQSWNISKHSINDKNRKSFFFYSGVGVVYNKKFIFKGWDNIGIGCIADWLIYQARLLMYNSRLN